MPNIVLPYCQNVNVSIHNNWIGLNSSTGDELFSAKRIIEREQGVAVFVVVS